MENDKSFEHARQVMVQIDLYGRDIQDKRVIEVMAAIPREGFIPPAYRQQAYNDGPLPIGLGQTISQPYIVALMTQELDVRPEMEVLEIGTGSGYQTAILARLVKKVYTIERFAELSKSAQKVLTKLEINNVEFFVGDGSEGWPGKKIFDRIIITAAVPEVPEELFKQLKDKGIMVAPVEYDIGQKLMVFKKQQEKVSENFICDVRFVRLIGKYGYGE